MSEKDNNPDREYTTSGNERLWDVPPFETIHDRILILPDKAADRTVGGIYLPEGAREKLQTATVIAVGPGKWEHGVFVPMKLKPGDRVLFSKYAGAEVGYMGVDYLFTSESQVYARLLWEPEKIELPPLDIDSEVERVHV